MTVHRKPRPDPPVKTVRSGPRTGQPDVSDGSAAGLCLLNLKTAGRLAGLRLRIRFSTEPTISDWKVANFLFDLSRLGLNSKRSGKIIEIRPDLFEICQDLIEIRLDLVEIDLISSRFAEISLRSDQTSPDPAAFWQNPADFLTTQNRLRTNLYPMKIRPPEPTPFTSWRRV